MVFPSHEVAERVEPTQTRAGLDAEFSLLDETWRVYYASCHSRYRKSIQRMGWRRSVCWELSRKDGGLTVEREGAGSGSESCARYRQLLTLGVISHRRQVGAVGRPSCPCNAGFPTVQVATNVGFLSLLSKVAKQTTNSHHCSAN